MADKQFIKDMLNAHNDYRKNHGVLPLKMNKDLNKSAQEWANNLASTNRFEHSRDRKHKGEPVGENLSMKWTSTNDEYTGVQATKQWYDEVSKYNFRTWSGAGTGHFSQLVWKASRELGIGKAQTRDGKWIAVAHYFPAGNYVGEHNVNVFPAGTKTPSGKSQPSGGACCSRTTVSTTSQGVPVVSAREFKPFHRDTHTTQPPHNYRSTTYTETTPSSSKNNLRYQQVNPPGGHGSATSKTVVTETVIGPDGRKKVTTREIVTTGHDVGSLNSATNHVHVPAGATAAPPPQTKEKPQKIKDFVSEVVKTHNKYRKMHGKAGDLKHNKELSTLAQSWAERLASTPGLQHSNAVYKGREVGENIAHKWTNYGADYRGREVVEQWYNEVNKYDFGSTTFRQGTGHFSQLVWKESKEIGIGKATNSDGRVYVVCNYWPPGNVLGQFQENVFPTKSK